MKKEKLLVVAVILLFILNLGTLGFLFLHKPPKPPGLGPKQLDRLIVEKLSLNPDQKQAFDRLKKAHHEQMVQHDKDYKTALDNYFSLLKNETVLPAQQDSLQAVLLLIQRERTQITFQHFVDLKALCSPEQRRNFDALLPDLMQVILPKRENEPRRGKKEEGR